MATTTPADRLRRLLEAPGLLALPGCHDGLSAKLLAAHGHRAAFMSGFSVSAARLGLPDTGLISFAEMVDTLRACCAAAPDLAIVADGDNGYGNALSVERTVREYARAGAAAVMIEDQAMPKTCDHVAAKQVIDRAEARMKIRAAVAAARESGVLILARTDARALLGFDAALERCMDFVAAGADLIFMDGPANEDEMRRLCAEVPRPCMANVLLGAGPALARDHLVELGFKLATYPHALLAAGAAAMRQAAMALAPDATTPMPNAVPFPELKTLVGFDDYFRRAALYATRYLD